MTDVDCRVRPVMRAVAAGIANGNARLVVTLMPQPDAAGGWDLRTWPVAAAALGGDALRVLACPSTLDAQPDKDRMVTTRPAGRVTARAPSGPERIEIARLWDEAMGAGGWKPLMDVLREAAPPHTTESGSATAPVPPLHERLLPKDGSGPHSVVATGRVEAALAMQLERARHMLDGLFARQGSVSPRAPTRGEAVASRGNSSTLVRLAAAGQAGLGWGLLAQAAQDPPGGATTAAEGGSAPRSAGGGSGAVPEGARSVVGEALDRALAQPGDGKPPLADLLAAPRAAHVGGTAADPADAGAEAPGCDSYLAALARRRLYALQAFPTLGRLFGFVLDVEVPLDELPGLPEPPGRDPLAQGPRGYVWLALQGWGSPRAWTLAKLRRPVAGDAGHFWPCTREEVQAASAARAVLAEAPQMDGVANLGLPGGGWELLTLDAVTATETDVQTERRRARPPENAAARETDAGSPTLRTAGLALVHGGRLQHAVGQLRQADRQAGALRSGGDITQDADELTVGWRLDVGVRGKTGRIAWRSLTERRITFAPGRKLGGRLLDDVATGLYPRGEADLPGKPGSAARLRADGAALVAVTRLDLRDNPTAHVEEILATWEGDLLGLECRPGKTPLPDGDLAIPMAFRPADAAARKDALPPQLCLSWRYFTGLRAAYPGGLTLPLDKAARLYGALDGQLALPAAAPDSAGRAARRHERVSAPTPLLLAGISAGLSGRMAPETAGRLVVRSRRDARDPGDTSGRDEPGRCLRVLLPPSVTLDFAALHGAFRTDNVESVQFWEPVTAPRPVTAGKVRRSVLRTIPARPRDGLRGVDYSAAWGGFPVIRAVGDDDLEVLDRDPAPGVDADAGWDPARGVPQGDALFRLARPSAPARRMPWYPDPTVDRLALGIRRVGRKEWLEKPFIIPLYPASGPGPVPAQFPNALPVVLDLQRSAPGEQRPRALDWAGSKAGQAVFDGKDVHPAGAKGGVPVRHVVLRLPPGEEVEVVAWCLPTREALADVFDVTESAALLAAREGGAGDPDLTLAAGLWALARLKLQPPEGGSGSLQPKGPGGLPLPRRRAMLAFADALDAAMQAAPIDELAAPLVLPASHAVDQAAPPAFAGSPGPPVLLRVDAAVRCAVLRSHPDEPRRDPVTWDLEAQVPGATEVLLAGIIGVDTGQADSLEVLARGPGVTSGRFDDPARGRSRDERARGVWPSDEASRVTAGRLFGFDVATDGRVTLPAEEATLLRLSFLAPPEGPIRPGPRPVDLLDVQRRAEQRGDAGDEPVPANEAGPRVERPAVFVDGKARRLQLVPLAGTRTAGLLRTRYDELLDERRIPGRHAALWLPATQRPDRVSPQGLLPSFGWQSLGPLSHRRTTSVRVRMRRPWFTSGEGERLGIVLWPPHLFSIPSNQVRSNQLPRRPDAPDLMALREFSDADLGPGGRFITRWGADPIRDGPGPRGWLLSAANFPGAAVWTGDPAEAPDGSVIRDVLMPVGGKEGETPREFMAVTLLVMAPRFDVEQELWFVDVALDPLDVPDPFVRLGLVRWQPMAPRHLQVSEPVTEWAQVLPARTVTVTVEASKGSYAVHVEVRGRASVPTAEGPGDALLRPALRAQVIRRETMTEGGDAEAVEAPLPPRPWQEPDDDPDNGGLVWRTQLPLRTDPRNPPAGVRYAVLVEEVERMRPASYPIEPFNEEDIDELVESGPRFAALVPFS